MGRKKEKAQKSVSSPQAPLPPTDTPNLFISWSGKSGHAALAFAPWIRQVIPEVRPWISKHDIAAGAVWHHELTTNLKTCSYGVFFVTKDNMAAPWLNYEAGAIANKLGIDTRVMVILLDQHRVTGPLEIFQATPFSEAGMKKLVLDMNDILGRAEWAPNLEIIFQAKWGDLQAAFKSVRRDADAASNSPPDSNTELLQRMAGLERLITGHSEAVLQRLSQLQSPTNNTILLGGGKPAISTGTTAAELRPAGYYVIEFPTEGDAASFVNTRRAPKSVEVPKLHRQARMPSKWLPACGARVPGSRLVEFAGSPESLSGIVPFVACQQDGCFGDV
jgi:hypothetical protein